MPFLSKKSLRAITRSIEELRCYCSHVSCDFWRQAVREINLSPDSKVSFWATTKLSVLSFSLGKRVQYAFSTLSDCWISAFFSCMNSGDTCTLTVRRFSTYSSICFTFELTVLIVCYRKAWMARSWQKPSIFFCFFVREPINKCDSHSSLIRQL